MSNKSDGNAFERSFAGKLKEYGFWVHLLQQNSAGQPADIIAVRDGNAYLIDCKVCALDRFLFSRMEDNQCDAMDFWNQCGNNPCYFALLTSDGEIYMADYDVLSTARSLGDKSWNLDEIKRHCSTLDEWELDA